MAHSARCICGIGEDKQTRIATLERELAEARESNKVRISLNRAMAKLADEHSAKAAALLARLGEAERLLAESEDLLCDWWNGIDGSGKGPLVGVIEDTAKLVPTLRAFLARPDPTPQAAPPEMIGCNGCGWTGPRTELVTKLAADICPACRGVVVSRSRVAVPVSKP